MSYLQHQPKLQRWHSFAFFEGAFSAAQCQSIIDIGDDFAEDRAQVGGDAHHGVDEVRRSRVRWLPWYDKTAFVYDKLAAIVGECRARFWPFALSGFEEELQLTRYLSRERGHYATHRDIGPGTSSSRKLSLVVVLNDLFRGGELHIDSIDGADKCVHQATRGTVIAFPAFELHKITEVTHGERRSLVAWVHGPPFS